VVSLKSFTLFVYVCSQCTVRAIISIPVSHTVIGNECLDLSIKTDI